MGLKNVKLEKGLSLGHLQNIVNMVQKVDMRQNDAFVNEGQSNLQPSCPTVTKK